MLAKHFAVGGTTRRVIHIVPYDGIGGVEIAARSMQDGWRGSFHFSKLYLVRKALSSPSNAPHAGSSQSENDPRAYWVALRTLLVEKPDVVIASLWRSCMLLPLLKSLRPSTTCVTFLHSAVDVHTVDRIMNRLAMLVSTEIWADSEASLRKRVPRFLQRRGRVISFVLQRQPEQAMPRMPRPRFVFWGRLHWQKDLKRALRVFARIRSARSDARFDIIGPDDGERSALECEASALGLDARAVAFHGPMAQADVFRFASSCSFYLQTSIDEGMGMAVVEAMQLGLAPIVTPVGEIASYCRDGENALLLGEEESAVRRVLALLDDPESYRALTRRSAATWISRRIYSEDVTSGCLRLLAAT